MHRGGAMFIVGLLGLILLTPSADARWLRSSAETADGKMLCVFEHHPRTLDCYLPTQYFVVYLTATNKVKCAETWSMEGNARGQLLQSDCH
jgi:hypothetical protein